MSRLTKCPEPSTNWLFQRNMRRSWLTLGDEQENAGEPVVLTILGNRQERFCDGLSRRSFLRIGSLGLGGLSMGRLLRAQSQSGQLASDRSLIIVYLPGGPTQHETFDPKPGAPAEIRGSFDAASTSIPGVQ